MLFRSCASTSGRHADEMLASAVRFIEQNAAEYYVTDVETETLAAL